MAKHLSLHKFAAVLSLLCVCYSCTQKKEQETTPWGGYIDENGVPITEDSVTNAISSGELIMLTVSGPQTYYDYHGHGLGLQYLLCEKFAEKLGISLRVELCSDSDEVIKRFKNGEGDLAVFSDFKYWQYKPEFSKDLKSWYSPTLLADIKQELDNLQKNGFVKRHVYPFMLNRKDAVISKYDGLFRQYASVAGVDWTLLAAQCYQESCFDPNAHSWAGACGLMQIIPSTADILGLPREDIYKPEPNIRAAAHYMAQLQNKFSDVSNRQERIRFALASYNGGFHHVRDAMALAEKYGKSPYRWSDVRQFILGLQSPNYYKDSVVKNGYMRGSETADYVDKIMDRWAQYRNATRGKYSPSVNAVPQPAKRKNKWDKE